MLYPIAKPGASVHPPPLVKRIVLKVCGHLSCSSPRARVHSPPRAPHPIKVATQLLLPILSAVLWGGIQLSDNKLMWSTKFPSESGGVSAKDSPNMSRGMTVSAQRFFLKYLDGCWLNGGRSCRAHGGTGSGPFPFSSKHATKIGLPRAGVHSQPREAYLT